MAADPRRIVSSMVEARALPCDKFGRVFASLWLQQQDEEGSRHHDPCGDYQEFDNKQDDDLHDGSI